MPTNVNAEYLIAEGKYRNAVTPEEKISALEEMIKAAPKHKGMSNVLADLKSKLAKLKKRADQIGSQGRFEEDPHNPQRRRGSDSCSRNA